MKDANANLLKIIGSADIDAFKSEMLNNKEIDFTEYEFWQILNKKTPWNNGHKRFVQFIDKEFIDDKILKININVNSYDYKMSFLRDTTIKGAFLKSFKNMLYDTFISKLYIDGFDGGLFKYLSKMDEKAINENRTLIIQHIAKDKLDMKKHADFFNYLSKLKDPTSSENLVKLFHSTNSLENIEFFKINFPYVYNRVINDKESIKHAFKGCQLDKLKFLLANGHTMPMSKDLLSQLFSKTEKSSHEFQDYMVNYFEDIAFENQIVLRTILSASKWGNYSRLPLLNSVLDRYIKEKSDDIIPLLTAAIHKREENNEYVKLIKSHIRYHELNQKINESNEPVKSKKKL